jgi:hypothetical protein
MELRWDCMKKRGCLEAFGAEMGLYEEKRLLRGLWSWDGIAGRKEAVSRPLELRWDCRKKRGCFEAFGAEMGLQEEKRLSRGLWSWDGIVGRKEAVSRPLELRWDCRKKRGCLEAFLVHQKTVPNGEMKSWGQQEVPLHSHSGALGASHWTLQKLCSVQRSALFHTWRSFR